MHTAMPYDDDDPPPWQPLRIPHALDTSADAHRGLPASAASAGIGNGPAPGPIAAAARRSQQEGSLQSGSLQGIRPEESQSTSEPHRREALHKEKLSTPRRPLESPFLGADSLGGSSSTSVQAVRSPEGDFFRLLDSPGPAPRASLHKRDLEQLPRSFSMTAKAKAAAVQEPIHKGSEVQEESNPAMDNQQGADMPSHQAWEPQESAHHDDEAGTHEKNGPPLDSSAFTATVAQHAEASHHAPEDAGLGKELQQPQQGASAEDTSAIAEQVSAAPGDPHILPSVQDAEATASGLALGDSSTPCADESAPSQLQGSQHEASPPPSQPAVPGLRDGAASADLSYTQLTALLGTADAQEDDLSELDDFSPPSTPRTEGDNNMTAALAEGIVAYAERAAAAQPDTPEQLTGPLSAEVHIDHALDSAPADVMLPDQHYSSAGDHDLAETLAHARDEQRLEQISQQHAATDLAYTMQRLAVLTGRQGGPISHAEHDSHMQHLAKLTGAQAEPVLSCVPSHHDFCLLQASREPPNGQGNNKDTYVHPFLAASDTCPPPGDAGGKLKTRVPPEEDEEPSADTLPDEVRQLLADATAEIEHGRGISVASEPDVAHLLLEAAREANADLARDAETDANMLEVRQDFRHFPQLLP